MIKINKDKFIIWVGYIAVILSCMVLPGSVSMILAILITLFIAVIGSNAAAHKSGKTTSLLLALPVIISAIQNVYLAIGAKHFSSQSIQVVLSMHYLLICTVIFLNAKKINRICSDIVIIFLLIIFQAFCLFIVYTASVVAVIASLRNITACLLFYMYSRLLGRLCDIDDYYKYIRAITLLVAFGGVIDIAVGTQMWQRLGITQLWNLKGIATNIAGIPPNWYSSEQIAGNILRRMVSTFADPVNLGTFLFSAFMISWYKKWNFLSVFILICMLLTVSKGALLGGLIFIVIYIWTKKKTRVLLPAIVICALVVGIEFVQFSSSNSSGSLMAHVTGFLSSFSVLVSNPFGLGVGNVGVLSGLFNASLANTAVSETGIGMIIAQLGIPGLILYISFFYKLIRNGLNIKKNESERTAILYLTLVLSFLANAMFNEVALSPNSCGLYFIQLGIIDSKIKQKARIK